MCLRSHWCHKKKNTWNFNLIFCMLHYGIESDFLVNFQIFWSTLHISFLFYENRIIEA
jgi:hypothetical protein